MLWDAERKKAFGVDVPIESGDASFDNDDDAQRDGQSAISVRRIAVADGNLLRLVRLRAIVDQPETFSTRLDQAASRPRADWDRVAEVHATADDQATWFAETLSEVDGVDEVVPVGMVSAFRTDDNAVTMTSLWTEAAWRQSGVGLVLVKTVQTWASELQASEVRQWLVARNQFALEFHEQLGFRTTGVERKYQRSPELCEVELRWLT